MRKAFRWSAGCLLLALVLGTASGCSSKKEEAGERVSAVADGVLTVGIINGGDAYAQKEGTELTGIEPEIMNRVGESLEVAVQYQEAENVEELMRLLDEGAVDIAAGRLTTMENYTAGHLYSRNYAKRGMYLVTGKNRYVDQLTGFYNVAVGVSWEIPTYVLLEVEGLSDLETAVYTAPLSMAADVEAGVIGAALCTEREALAMLESAKVQAAELRLGPKLEAVFYLQPGQEQLLNGVNQAINEYLDEQAQEG